jgi:hypothetical protein
MLYVVREDFILICAHQIRVFAPESVKSLLFFFHTQFLPPSYLPFPFYTIFSIFFNVSANACHNDDAILCDGRYYELLSANET